MTFRVFKRERQGGRARSRATCIVFVNREEKNALFDITRSTKSRAFPGSIRPIADVRFRPVGLCNLRRNASAASRSEWCETLKSAGTARLTVPHEILERAMAEITESSISIRSQLARSVVLNSYSCNVTTIEEPLRSRMNRDNE